jgi:hypothetical protein
MLEYASTGRQRTHALNTATGVDPEWLRQKSWGHIRGGVLIDGAAAGDAASAVSMWVVCWGAKWGRYPQLRGAKKGAS